MAKKEDSPAKLAILHEWDRWAKEHPEAASPSGSLRFFEHLKNLRPDLLLISGHQATSGKACVHGCELREK